MKQTNGSRINMEKYIDEGITYNVAPNRLEEFLQKFPNATKVDEPGKTSDSTMTSPNVGSSIMGSSLGGGSSEQPKDVESYQRYRYIKKWFIF